MAANTRNALIGTGLFIPGAMVFSMLLLGIEPTFGPLVPSGPGSPHMAQSLLVLGLVVVLPAIALSINVFPLVRARRPGQALLAHPTNLAVAIASVGIIGAFLGANIVDQYQCWMGGFNCD